MNVHSNVYVFFPFRMISGRKHLVKQHWYAITSCVDMAVSYATSPCVQRGVSCFPLGCVQRLTSVSLVLTRLLNQSLGKCVKRKDFIWISLS